MSSAPPPPSTEAVRANAEYYEAAQPGRDDYWRLMAAPRSRRAVVLREIGSLQATKVVDLGCGGGEMLAEIRRQYPDTKLSGVDLSHAAIERNRTRDPSVQWFVLDLDAGGPPPPELSGAMDVVVAMEIIEHVDHPDAFLRSCLGLARPGGRLVLSTQSGPVRETERRVGHRRHFSRGDMRDFLTGAGWVPERVWNTGWPFHDFSKWWANRDPDASLDRFSGTEYGPVERFLCWGLRMAFALNSSRRGAQLYAVGRRP